MLCGNVGFDVSANVSYHAKKYSETRVTVLPFQNQRYLQYRRYGGLARPNGCLCPPFSFTQNTVFETSLNKTTNNDRKRNNYVQTLGLPTLRLTFPGHLNG